MRTIVNLLPERDDGVARKEDSTDRWQREEARDRCRESDVLPTWMFDAPAVKWFRANPPRMARNPGEPTVAGRRETRRRIRGASRSEELGEKRTRTGAALGEETGRLENQPSTGLELLIGI